MVLLNNLVSCHDRLLVKAAKKLRWKQWCCGCVRSSLIVFVFGPLVVPEWIKGAFLLPVLPVSRNLFSLAFSGWEKKRPLFLPHPPPRSIAGKRGLRSSVNKELACSLVENDEESMLFNVVHCHWVQRERTKTRAKNNKETCRAS